MEVSMEITRDIIVKMIEHGSFDSLQAVTSETANLQSGDLMTMKISKAYKMLFETVCEIENNRRNIEGQQLYLVENQT